MELTVYGVQGELSDWKSHDAHFEINDWFVFLNYFKHSFHLYSGLYGITCRNKGWM